MDVKVMLFLLLACGTLPEGYTREYPPFHGVNGPKGKTREPQPFHCTKPAKESTSNHEPLEHSTTKQSTALSNTENSPAVSSKTVPFTVKPTTGNQRHDVVITERLNPAQQTEVTTERLGSSSPTEGNFTSDQQSTKQLTSTPPSSVTGLYPTTDQQTTKQLNTTSPSPLTDRHLTSDQQITKQLNTTSVSPLTERNLTSEQQTTQRPTPPTSSPCAPNMVLGPNCNCRRTCQDPISCDCTGPPTCVCPDGFLMNNTECIPEQNCGCYYEEGELVIPDGDIYVNHGCSKKCHCSNNSLSCHPTYACGPDATCKVKDGVRQCYCNYGYVGDGVTCTRLTDCNDAYQAGKTQDGVYTIFPHSWTESPFKVWCDMTTNGGGWTVLQRRRSSEPSFVKNWSRYRIGFNSSRNYWLGNDKIHYLTNQRNYKLRVDMELSGGSTIYQEYSLFEIADESDKYKLIKLGDSNGTAGDGMAGSLERQFSTHDRDNDKCNDIPCSQKHGDGGWWYSNKWCGECCDSNEQTCCFYYSSGCRKRCTKANLNGKSIGIQFSPA